MDAAEYRLRCFVGPDDRRPAEQRPVLRQFAGLDHGFPSLGHQLHNQTISPAIGHGRHSAPWRARRPSRPLGPRESNTAGKTDARATSSARARAGRKTTGRRPPAWRAGRRRRRPVRPVARRRKTQTTRPSTVTSQRREYKKGRITADARATPAADKTTATQRARSITASGGRLAAERAAEPSGVVHGEMLLVGDARRRPGGVANSQCTRHAKLRAKEEMGYNAG